MPRSAASAIENKFNRGLITEFGALNAPENGCSEIYDCVVNFTGTVSRRLGIDLEAGATATTIDRTNAAVNTFIWRSVGNDGTVNFAVVQVGSRLYFYDLSVGVLSSGKLASTIDLTSFKPSGAPDPSLNECQFASGNGLLFVFHPTLESFYVTYDSSAGTVSGTALTLQTRDFAYPSGSSTAIDARSSSLAAVDRYNLCNQGWGSYIAEYTSTTSFGTGTGSKTFTIATGLTISANEAMYIYSQGAPENNMTGTVTSYTSGTGALVMNVTAANGSATKTDWAIARQPPYISIFKTQMGVYPSNADIWWAFKDSNEDFYPSKTDAHVVKTNARAPNGHFIVNPYNIQRSTVSGITGITDETTSYQRAGTGAFFAGRVFYAGVNYSGQGGKIFFSQLSTNSDQYTYARCYQRQDPTSDTLFDLLPDDGGVINIPEAGTIIKLFPFLSALLVFATNGIWSVSGSSSVGFAANDYTVSKVSSVFPASATTFVDVLGTPYFWANEDIYVIKADPSQGGLQAVPITHNTISTFFNAIPKTSKQKAHGAYNKSSYTIQWVYRSTDAGDLTSVYSYDRILVFDTLVGAFYIYRIPVVNPTMNGIVAIDAAGASVSSSNVIDAAGDTVVDAAGDTIVVYSVTVGSTVTNTFKYLVSSTNGSSFDVTWAEERDENYVDWASTNSSDFTSTFTCVPKVHGQGQKKFQSNYLYVFYDNSAINSFTVAPYWNYSNDAAGGKVGRTQTLTGSGANFDIAFNRIKIPGEGVALQYKFNSVSGKPFTIHGWSAFETGTTIP